MAVRRIVLATLFLVCVGSAGGASVPRALNGEADPAGELAAHVQFLCQPRLKGRSPGTRGSRIARHYIESRFKAYGLVPWAHEKDYGLSFGYGKNVVGVLPGSDTNLAREIVLLSAHYDHLGKKKAICPGASDNASGVAALLQTARRLSLPGHRPKRSVAFAAFDCEEQMLLGSFAFSGREDVQRAKVVAVINVDMLGRDFLDVVQNTVFVAGTERYPALRNQVRLFGTNAGLRVLPIGTDLIGPRSDHIAFESRDIPCLFFSCGTYGDYHQPTDTPEKLNYTSLERAAAVILETVEALGNSEETPTAAREDLDPEELRTVSTVMDEVTKRAADPALKKEDIEAFKRLQTTAQTLLKSGQFDREKREQLVIEATGILAPYLVPVDDWGKGLSAGQQEYMMASMQYLQHFYLNYRKEILDGYRELVAQILKHRPGPFRGMPNFTYEIFDIADDDIRVAETAQGTYALNVLVNDLVLKAERTSSRWPLKSFSLAIVGDINGIDCEGTREELADACLLRWRRHQTNELRSARLKKVLRAVTGVEPNGDYQELLRQRLQAGGFTDETDWLVSCILGPNLSLMQTALSVTKGTKEERIRKAAHRVVVDRKIRPDIRATAIELTAMDKDRAGLLALCAVLDDTTPAYKLEYMAPCQDGYPFAERMAIKTVRPLIEKQQAAWPSKTIGDLAHDALKNVTKKDYAKDAARWRKWIESRVVSRPSIDSGLLHYGTDVASTVGLQLQRILAEVLASKAPN